MTSIMLGRLYVRYIGLEKRMSEVLIMPGIVFFMKAKRDKDGLPPNHGALELHITRVIYQFKIWLHADHVIMADMGRSTLESNALN